MAARGEAVVPIHLRSSLHETIWGGRQLAAFAGKSLPHDTLIGESWETALDTVARNSPYAGRSLSELVELLGEDLLGARAIAVYGRRFPLLAKFIDAQQQLSVQVHPNDTYASEHEGGKLGKTEAWYILHAEPGARVVYGVRKPTSRDEVRAAIANSRLEDLLNEFEVRPGDVIFVPAGTVHAICGGIVLYELQEYSDITYRLYDYGRLQADGRPRALHIEAALNVMRFAPPAATRVAPVVVSEGKRCARRVLVGCHYFLLEEVRFSGALDLSPTPESCQILTVLAGGGELRWSGGALPLALGETVVLPAALRGAALEGEQLHVVRSYVPTEDDPHLRAWREAQPAPFDDC
jgi:mannose-6-phosphate isomerase